MKHAAGSTQLDSREKSVRMLIQSARAHGFRVTYEDEVSETTSQTQRRSPPETPAEISHTFNLRFRCGRMYEEAYISNRETLYYENVYTEQSDNKSQFLTHFSVARDIFRLFFGFKGEGPLLFNNGQHYQTEDYISLPTDGALHCIRESAATARPLPEPSGSSSIDLGGDRILHSQPQVDEPQLVDAGAVWSPPAQFSAVVAGLDHTQIQVDAPQHTEAQVTVANDLTHAGKEAYTTDAQMEDATYWSDLESIEELPRAPDPIDDIRRAFITGEKVGAWEQFGSRYRYTVSLHEFLKSFVLQTARDHRLRGIRCMIHLVAELVLEVHFWRKPHHEMAEAWSKDVRSRDREGAPYACMVSRSGIRLVNRPPMVGHYPRILIWAACIGKTRIPMTELKDGRAVQLQNVPRMTRRIMPGQQSLAAAAPGLGPGPGPPEKWLAVSRVMSSSALHEDSLAISKTQELASRSARKDTVNVSKAQEIVFGTAQRGDNLEASETTGDAVGQQLERKSNGLYAQSRTEEMDYFENDDATSDGAMSSVLDDNQLPVPNTSTTLAGSSTTVPAARSRVLFEGIRSNEGRITDFREARKISRNYQRAGRAKRRHGSGNPLSHPYNELVIAATERGRPQSISDADSIL